MKYDARTEALIQGALDGVLDDEQLEEMKTLLDQDPGIAGRFEALSRAEALARGLPEVDPPADLRPAVMAAIRARQARAARGQEYSPTFPARAGNWIRTIFTEGLAMKNGRIGIIAGAAAAIVAALVYFGGFYPPKSDEAAGTIGAVKKYHSEQITEQDVVLGSTGDFGGVPFADLVGESASLGSISRDIQAFAAKLNAKSLDAKAVQDELGRMTRSLDARMASLDAKRLEMMRLQAKTVSAALQAKNSLDAKTLENMRLDAKAAAASLDAKNADLAGAKSKLDAAVRELGRMARLDAKTLESAAPSLESMKKGLEAKTLDAKVAQDELGRMARSLDARNVSMEAKSLEARQAYLDAAASHAAELVGVRTELGRMAREFEAKSNLDSKRLEGMRTAADELGAKLQVRSAELQAKSLESMNAQLESARYEQKTLMGMKANAELAAKSLESRSAELGRMISQSLDAKVLEASSRLGSISAAELGACQRVLAARDLALNAKSLESMRAYLDNVSAALQSRSASMESRTQGMQDQLGAVSAALQARTQQ